MGCEKLASYLDRDEREHRCDAHMDLALTSDAEEQLG